MTRANARVQSLPYPGQKPATHDLLVSKFDPQIAPLLRNFHDCLPTSADRLVYAVNFLKASKETTARLTVNTISTTDCNLIRSYLDNFSLLQLDACSTIQRSLQNTRRDVSSITIALHYLEGEHEPSSSVLKRVAAALESCDFKDRQCSIELEKCMSKLRALGKKLREYALDQGISPELYRALNGSWTMGDLVFGVLGSSATFGPQVHPFKAERWAVLLNEVSKRMKKNPIELGVGMQELEGTALAAKALLKLVSEWYKGGSGLMRRVAVKAVAGELQKRREELEKALQPVEEKIGELYKQLVEFRMRLLGLLSEAQNDEVVLELLKPEDSWGEDQMDFNPAQLHKSVNWVRAKSTKRSWSKVSR